MRKVLLSDLDGTLLDLKSYSFAQSEASVNELKEEGVPIVFCFDDRQTIGIPIVF